MNETTPGGRDMDRWADLADRLLAPVIARFGDNPLVLEQLVVPVDGIVEATDVAALCRCAPSTAAALTTLLDDARSRHAVKSLVVAARCVPEPLLRPMLLAAAQTLNLSFNRDFVQPCTVAFGRRRVVATLLDIAVHGSNPIKAGAVNALYWAWQTCESVSGADARDAGPAGQPDEPIEDLREEFLTWAVREFVANDDIEVRRSLASTLAPARSYEPGLADRAIAIGRAHDDHYIRQRVAVDCGEARLTPCLPKRAARTTDD